MFFTDRWSKYYCFSSCRVGKRRDRKKEHVVCCGKMFTESIENKNLVNNKPVLRALSARGLPPSSWIRDSTPLLLSFQRIHTTFKLLCRKPLIQLNFWWLLLDSCSRRLTLPAYTQVMYVHLVHYKHNFTEIHQNSQNYAKRVLFFKF